MPNVTIPAPAESTVAALFNGSGHILRAAILTLYHMLAQDLFQSTAYIWGHLPGDVLEVGHIVGCWCVLISACRHTRAFRPPIQRGGHPYQSDLRVLEPRKFHRTEFGDTLRVSFPLNLSWCTFLKCAKTLLKTPNF